MQMLSFLGFSVLLRPAAPPSGSCQTVREIDHAKRLRAEGGRRSRGGSQAGKAENAHAIPLQRSDPYRFIRRMSRDHNPSSSDLCAIVLVGIGVAWPGRRSISAGRSRSACSSRCAKQSATRAAVVDSGVRTVPRDDGIFW